MNDLPKEVMAEMERESFEQVEIPEGRKYYDEANRN